MAPSQHSQPSQSSTGGVSGGVGAAQGLQSRETTTLVVQPEPEWGQWGSSTTDLDLDYPAGAGPPQDAHSPGTGWACGSAQQWSIVRPL